MWIKSLLTGQSCGSVLNLLSGLDGTVLHEVCNLPDFRVCRRNVLSVTVTLLNVHLQLFLYECGKDEKEDYEEIFSVFAESSV